MTRQLNVAAALMNAAMGTASATGTIVVADRIGPGLGGLPATAGVLGTAAGAVAIGRLTRRTGRPKALWAGYVGSAIGGILTVAAVLSGRLAWLFAGMLLLGAGNAAAQLSRYAAADLAEPGRRAAAMSTVVWAATFGGVAGPLLLEPAGRAAEGFGLVAVSGPFLLVTVATAGAVLVISRFQPRPATSSRYAAAMAGPVRRTATMGVRQAAAVMMTGQVVMVAVTTAVPVHTHHLGHSMSLLGLMLSGHTFGMFALSPLTGRLIDRFGPRPVALGGTTTLVAVGVALLFPLGGGALAVALFVLGYGWNLCFVGGSAAVSRAGRRPGRDGQRLESAVEAWAWTVSAGATAVSTVLLAAGGFRLLGLVSLVLLGPLLAGFAIAPRPVDDDSAVRPDAGTLCATPGR